VDSPTPAGTKARVLTIYLLLSDAPTLCQVILMPDWVLECDSCKAEIIRSAIADKELRALFPSKPDLPAGSELDCPSCGKTGAYQSRDFIYRA
jgi:hypothetical protein